jgi:hypothetical protein
LVSYTCCERDVLLKKPEMPEGQKWDFGAWITGSIFKGLKEGKSLSCSPTCPIEVWLSDLESKTFSEQFAEYIFDSVLEVDPTGYEEENWEEGIEPGTQVMAGGGSLIGDWTLHVELIDNVHGVTLKEGDFSWEGTISDINVRRKWIDGAGVYVPYFGGYEYPLANWIKKFMPKPLNVYLWDYERTPERCKIIPEKQIVVAGEEIKIRIKEITDRKGRPSQRWQRLFVKVDKGQILNGTPREKFRVFEIEDGAIEVEYKAPDDCRKEEETIEVHNSCGLRAISESVTEVRIEEKKFNIVCLEVELRWSGGCVSFGQEVTTFNLPVNTQEKPHTVEWHGKVSKSCSWDDDGYKCEISNRANFRITGKILPEKDETEKLELVFEWKGFEIVSFERFENKDTNPIGGSILIDVPLKPGDYGVTLIEGAKKVRVHPLLPIQDKRSFIAEGNYMIGNWAIMRIRI